MEHHVTAAPAWRPRLIQAIATLVLAGTVANAFWLFSIALPRIDREDKTIAVASEAQLAKSSDRNAAFVTAVVLEGVLIAAGALAILLVPSTRGQFRD